MDTVVFSVSLPHRAQYSALSRNAASATFITPDHTFKFSCEYFDSTVKRVLQIHLSLSPGDTPVLMTSSLSISSYRTSTVLAVLLIHLPVWTRRQNNSRADTEGKKEGHCCRSYCGDGAFGGPHIARRGCVVFEVEGAQSECGNAILANNTVNT